MKRIDLIKMAELLAKKPHTPEELAPKLGIQKRTAQGLLAEYHEKKQVHITAWGGARMTTRSYAWGKGKDAERPEPRNGVERMRDSRERRKLAKKKAVKA